MAPDFAAADVIVSFGCDFLGPGPSQIATARAFSEARRGRRGEMRLHFVEAAPTLTGAAADHRLAARPSRIAEAAEWLASTLEGEETAPPPEEMAGPCGGSWRSCAAPEAGRWRWPATARRGRSPPRWASLVWLVEYGVGIWGINTTNVWGYAIANYVRWIGIGNAGALISAMLLLTRQRWRTSISRFSEAMTLFAAVIAGLFPIFHLGRPWFFYWLAPYPDPMGLLPQWGSPLVWDFFAIASYLIFSLLFWFAGAIPDFAAMRDRARGAGRIGYGIVALGWRGSARHWRHWQAFYGAMAALGVPLVISVHSVVGLDFAAGMSPGWNETIFPPYFVVGAMFLGFAMVVVLAASIRKALGLERLVTVAHFEVMARILRMASLIMTASHATEWFFSLYSGEEAETYLTRFQLFGRYWPYYWTMLACNCLFPLVSPCLARGGPSRWCWWWRC